MDHQTLTLLIVIGLPPAVIECVALVYARGWLRLALALAVFAVPLLILAWLLATASQPGGDNLARLGFVSLAIILLGGAVIGAAFGGLIVLFRNMRRKGAA